MDLHSKKYLIIQEIISLTSEELLDKVKAVLQTRHEEVSPELRKLMSERSDKSEADIKAGRVYSLDEAKERIRNRLNERQG